MHWIFLRVVRSLGTMKNHVNRACEQFTRLLAGTTREDIRPDRITQAALQR
jgi:hypothetical protein